MKPIAPSVIDPPAEFVDKVQRMFGDRGRAWLPTLPDIITRCREKWGLAEGAPAPFMSMNWIEFTTAAAGDPVALKIGVPHDDLFTEMEALRAFEGNGAVHLVDADRELAAILMDRIIPGTMLWKLGDDEEQTRLAGAVMCELSVMVPARHRMPRLADQVAKAFARNRATPELVELMPEELMCCAEDLLRQMLEDEPCEVMLHGDLHHENILLDKHRGWLAIDPKGVIGPGPYQAARFLNNRIPDGTTTNTRAAMMRTRLHILGDLLGHSPSTLAAATFIDCILGTSWSFEDEGSFDVSPSLDHARMLQRFL